MKRIAVILVFAAVAAGVALSPALAGSWYQLTTKTVSITVTVTPSPVVYVPRTVAQAVKHPAPHPEVFALLDPAKLRAYHMLAQVGPTQSNVPVTMNVQADPTAKYLHVVNNATVLKAGYGSTSYACAYAVYAKAPYTWRVNDWVYGTAPTGSKPFPTFNYSTTSALAWLAETVTSSYQPFKNSGSPGEEAFTGSANVSKQICIDLQLTVPNNIPAGTYSTTIEYQLQYYY
ncbi:MAG: hypothetical protein KGM44_08160 [bacterium]|nr:hypothetical protein [bacterium]